MQWCRNLGRSIEDASGVNIKLDLEVLLDNKIIGMDYNAMLSVYTFENSVIVISAGKDNIVRL